MRLLRLLPDRWEKFIREALRFGIVGGINLVINYAVFNALALTVFKDGQLKATVVATIVATISSYLMNRHWTYRDRRGSALRRESALFFLFNATGLAIEVGVLAVAKYGLGLHGLLALNVAKTCGVVLATMFRFWSYRTFVFQATTATPDSRTEQDMASTLDLRDAAAAMDTARVTGDARTGTNGHRPSTPPAVPGHREVPLEVQFADTIDVELEAELATGLNADLAPELDTTSRRSVRR